MKQQKQLRNKELQRIEWMEVLLTHLKVELGVQVKQGTRTRQSANEVWEQIREVIVLLKMSRERNINMDGLKKMVQQIPILENKLQLT